MRDRLIGHTSPAARRGRRSFQPKPEGLETRQLLSVGMDPNYGFGGVAELPVPATTATNSYSDYIGAVALQNGQVVAVGYQQTSPASVGSSTSELMVSRFTTGGAIDTTFGTGGTTLIPLTSGGTTYQVTDYATEAIAVQSNGTIDVLATVTPTPSSSTSDFVVAQLTPNGALDTTFNATGYNIFNFGTTAAPATGTTSSALAIAPSGKLVAVGSTTLAGGTATVFAVAQLNSNGTLDTTFNSTGLQTVAFNTGGSTAQDDTANGVAIQSNGDIVVVGQANLPTSSSTMLTGQPSDIAVARLTSAGALDTTFNGTGTLTFNYSLGGTTSNDSAQAVAIDGTQIVIAGTSNELFTQPSTSTNTPNVSALTVTRLTTSGAFDTTFNGTGKFTLSYSQAGITFNSSATGVTVLPGGTLLLAGNSVEQNTQDEANYNGMLLELTSAGALDTSYGTNGVAMLTDSVDGAALVQTDGKVVYNSGYGVVRTTAPTPAVASTAIVTTGTGKSASATSVTLTFNTAVNPTLVSNIKIYTLKVGKRTIKIKKVSYNSTTFALTLSFAKTKARKGFTLTIAPGDIVAADGEVLNGGSPITISIMPSTSSSTASARTKS